MRSPLKEIAGLLRYRLQKRLRKPASGWDQDGGRKLVSRRLCFVAPFRPARLEVTPADFERAVNTLKTRSDAGTWLTLLHLGAESNPAYASG